MKAILLAAGEGKRMRPLTLETPKPMIDILGKPLLHHIIDSLPKEITEVIVVIGYKGEQVEKYFGSNFEGRKMTYVWQNEPKGTGQALELCKPFIEKDERFLFMIGDDLHSPQALARLIRHPFAMLVHEHADPKRFGVVEVDANDRVISFEEKPEKPKSNLVSPGVLMLNEKIFDYPKKLHRMGEYFAVDQANQMMKDYPMIAERSEFWHPIGYPHDVDTAEAMLAKKYPISADTRRHIPLIILAGGKGTRMPDGEKDKPKVMVDIAGKPLLQHQLEMAQRQGFTNIRLALGYKAEIVIDWLKSAGYGSIEHVVEDKSLGTGGAIKFAARGITTPFIAINGDDIADVNYGSLIRHGANAKYNVVTGMEIDDARIYGLIEHDESKKISRFKEKDPSASKGIVNIGHYYLKPEIFADTPEVFSMEHDIFPKLAEKGGLVLMKHMGNYWFGCGTPETLKATREYFSKSHA